MYAIARIDMREPIGKYIPVWMLEDHKHIQGIYDYKKRFDENPAGCMEEMFGVKLFWYQKEWFYVVYKIKEIFKCLW